MANSISSLSASTQKGNMLVVVGAQYGSEGKGAIVAQLADQYNVHVRVGSSNAGHTVFYKGKEYKMQTIPCGWLNEKAFLVIGRGALINMEILMREIEMLKEVDPNIKRRLVIDNRAGILDKKFEEIEGHTHGELHQRIGSTGEGVGAARIARISRDPDRFKMFYQIAKEYGLAENMYDTVRVINNLQMKGNNVLLEGTQGCGLSLIHGPWPYATSADTNAGQIIADCGISPLAVNKILLVARTFPIRVAGNSGPLKNEMTWDYMSELLGKKVEEKTTVTKKTRRIGKWDEELMTQAVIINRPTAIALTFVDYLNPEDEGKTNYDDLSASTVRFIEYLESDFNTPVCMIKTGMADEHVIKRGEI